MSSVQSWYVARKACTDVRFMEYFRKVCKSELEFMDMLKHESCKKEETLRPSNEGLRKSHVDHVSCYNGDDLPKRTKRKGRFLITLSPPVVVRKGRFLVTKMFVFNKPEPKKPTVTRKGRFMITSY